MKANFNAAVAFVRTFFLVMFYYLFSISLTFYNKWLIKHFHFPLSVTMIHYTIVFLMAAIIRHAWELYHQHERVLLSWPTYFKRVFPSAVASSFDIGLSNWSFMFITVSLYTMSKSSSVIFILMFSLLLKLEKPRFSLIFVVLLIAIGLFMFTYESTQFNLEGFIIAMLASATSGLRWTSVQLIMQKESLGLSNPIDTIYHLQPVMAVTLLPLAIFIEGPRMSASRQLWLAHSWRTAYTSIVMMLIGAFLAFLLSVSEYMLVCNTSGLALAIAGILKEICTLSIATEFGGDKLNILNFIGLVICMSGIGLHVFLKSRHGSDSEQHRYRELQTHDDKEETIDLRELRRLESTEEEEEQVILSRTSAF